MTAPAEEAMTGRIMRMHGEAVRITRASCHCGGDYAWERRGEDGRWAMVGCVCHNPALGV